MLIIIRHEQPDYNKQFWSLPNCIFDITEFVHDTHVRHPLPCDIWWLLPYPNPPCLLEVSRANWTASFPPSHKKVNQSLDIVDNTFLHSILQREPRDAEFELRPH